MIVVLLAISSLVITGILRGGDTSFYPARLDLAVYSYSSNIHFGFGAWVSRMSVVLADCDTVFSLNMR